MTEEVNEVGSIQISPQAIASIAYQAVIQSYGVVGLASKNIMDGLTNMIVKDPTHGIDVHLVEKHIVIDVYIIVQYGTRIKEVANSLANTVKFNVEKSLGLPVEKINVHVQGLRLSDPD